MLVPQLVTLCCRPPCRPVRWSILYPVRRGTQHLSLEWPTFWHFGRLRSPEIKIWKTHHKAPMFRNVDLYICNRILRSKTQQKIIDPVLSAGNRRESCSASKQLSLPCNKLLLKEIAVVATNMASDGYLWNTLKYTKHCRVDYFLGGQVYTECNIRCVVHSTILRTCMEGWFL